MLNIRRSDMVLIKPFLNHATFGKNKKQKKITKNKLKYWKNWHFVPKTTPNTTRFARSNRTELVRTCCKL